jgi:transcription-repair coupling factor (superfamily II helicase)
MYKRLAEVRTAEQVEEVRAALTDRYGPPPAPVDNLLAVASLRVKARQAGLTDVNLQGNYVRFAPVELPDSVRVRIDRLYPKTIVKTALRSMLVPRPTPGALKVLATQDSSDPGGERAVLDWASRVIEDAVPAVRPQPEGAAQS